LSPFNNPWIKPASADALLALANTRVRIDSSVRPDRDQPSYNVNVIGSGMHRVQRPRPKSAMVANGLLYQSPLLVSQ
jgi:hypothetical protein